VSDDARRGPAADTPQGAGTGLSDRQLEIVDAATEVFGERGYVGGSMREIATRLKVTEPALYRHFPGKRALFSAVIRVVGGHVREEAIALIAAMRPELVHEQFIALLDDRRRAIEKYAPVVRAIANAAVTDPAMLDELRAAVIAPVIAQVTEKVAEFDRVFGAADADATRPARVRSLVALFVGTIVTSVVLGDRPDQAVSDSAIRVLGWQQPQRPA
jgi:AcrR family transcriptional regulator